MKMKIKKKERKKGTKDSKKKKKKNYPKRCAFSFFLFPEPKLVFSFPFSRHLSFGPQGASTNASRAIRQ